MSRIVKWVFANTSVTKRGLFKFVWHVNWSSFSITFFHGNFHDLFLEFAFFCKFSFFSHVVPFSANLEFVWPAGNYFLLKFVLNNFRGPWQLPVSQYSSFVLLTNIFEGRSFFRKSIFCCKISIHLQTVGYSFYNTPFVKCL